MLTRQEKRREYNRAWREANPDYQRQWREANREKVNELGRAYARAYRAANSEKLRQRDRDYYNRNIDAKRAQARSRSTAHCEPTRRRVLLQKFGITVEQYDAMLEGQAGGCAICGDTNPNGSRLSVDHDHGTGNVRGLLCGSCNRAIGLLGDDPELLRRATTYLEETLERMEAMR